MLEIIDLWGSGEINNANNANNYQPSLLPIYYDLKLNNDINIIVKASNFNKLWNRQESNKYVRFLGDGGKMFINAKSSIIKKTRQVTKSKIILPKTVKNEYYAMSIE